MCYEAEYIGLMWTKGNFIKAQYLFKRVPSLELPCNAGISQTQTLGGRGCCRQGGIRGSDNCGEDCTPSSPLLYKEWTYQQPVTRKLSLPPENTTGR